MDIKEIIKDCLYEQNIYYDYVAEMLFSCYGEAKRFYHNLNHIENTLNYLAKIKEYDYINNYIFRNSQISLIFHDVIYETNSKRNEENSADLVGHFISNNSIFDINIIKKAILATKHDGNNLDNFIAKIVVDCDLASLAENWEIYQNYTNLIWKEYEQVYTNEQFKQGRIKWLKEFLSKPKIFQTKFFNEKQARENLEREIKIYL